MDCTDIIGESSEELHKTNRGNLQQDELALHRLGTPETARHCASVGETGNGILASVCGWTWW